VNPDELNELIASLETDVEQVLDPDVVPEMGRLDEVELALVEAIQTARSADPVDLDTIRRLTPHVQAIQTRRGELVEAAEQAQAEADELIASITPEDSDEGSESEDDGEGGDGDEPADVDEQPEGEGAAPAVEPEEPTEPVVTPIAATVRPRAATMTRPAGTEPRAERPVAFESASNLPGFPEGTPVDDLERFGFAVAEKIDRMRRHGTTNGPVALGTVRAVYPDDRTLAVGADDESKQLSNGRKVDAVARYARDRANNDYQGVASAGGLCAPLDNSFDLYGIGDARRPVRDGFLRFGTDRGGIRRITPPSLATINTDVDGTYTADDDTAVVLWTEATDTNPGANVKPCQTISCGTETTDVIDALTQCLQVGNFQKMTFAEHFGRWWELATIAHARTADEQLWDRASTAGTGVTTGQLLGFARDYFENLGQAAAQYRSRHRMGRTETLQVITPDWSTDAIRADLLRQLPGDNTYAVTDQTIATWYANMHLVPVYSPDAEQEFAAQPAGHLLAWPNTIEVMMFAPGTHLFLDGGTLDFGMEIRDSTLNQTNDVQAFMETFEGHAMVGVESLNLLMDVCPSGKSSAGEDVDPCTSGS